MSRIGIEYLGEMAKTVPENGVIVEIGPLFGSSTWVLAKNAHPSVQIYSIDTWEPDKWIERINKTFKNSVPFSKEAFLHYTRDCPNVTAIQGWSPEVVKDWDKPIDLYFDDATHGNPGFRENMDFFMPFIKPNGIVCGDDYAFRWPDIVREVDDLGDKWGVKPEIKGRVWSLNKPVSDAPPPFVYSKLKDLSGPQIRLDVSTFKRGDYDLPPDVWAGSVHKPDPIKRIALNWEKAVSGLDVTWQLTLSDQTTTEWLGTGDSYEVDQDNLVMGFNAKLSGAKALLYSLEYQAGFCWGLDGIKRFQHSYIRRNGVPLLAENKKIAINSLRLSIYPKTNVVGKVVDHVARKIYTQEV